MDFPVFLSFLSLLLALALDRVFGEPQRFHPLVGFGNYVIRLERWLNKEGAQRKLLRGVAGVLLAVFPFLVALSLIRFCTPSEWQWVFDGVVLYFCIGYLSLRQHAMAVYKELAHGNSEGGRIESGKIVSRDTAELDNREVSQACVESVLENSSDAVFATIFWFLIAGLPGALLHRMVNTLDAMWGYRSERFNLFGRFAARTDDVLNYVPARLTAVGFLLVAGTKARVSQGIRCWKTQASACSSPNGGIVMTTGAGVLNVKLSQRAKYHGVWQDKPLMGSGEMAMPESILRSLNLVGNSLMVWVMISGGLALVQILR